MKLKDTQFKKSGKHTLEAVYQCDCNDEKRIRVVYDGGFDGKYTIEFCQNCYDEEDKEFMISMEEIL